MEILAWEIVGLDAPARLKLKRAGDEDRPTVAVLDFEGRGITMMEAKTLTDRFSTELSNTERVIMVERNTMNDVLEAQGFESGGCTSNECAAEVGALLGVQFMINGAIGKIGNTYYGRHNYNPGNPDTRFANCPDSQHIYNSSCRYNSLDGVNRNY